MSELLDQALKALGGLERWPKVQSPDVRVSLAAGLYPLKGLPGSVREALPLSTSPTKRA